MPLNKFCLFIFFPPSKIQTKSNSGLLLSERPFCFIPKNILDNPPPVCYNLMHKTGELVLQAERKRIDASTHNLIRIMPT